MCPRLLDLVQVCANSTKKNLHVDPSLFLFNSYYYLYLVKKLFSHSPQPILKSIRLAWQDYTRDISFTNSYLYDRGRQKDFGLSPWISYAELFAGKRYLCCNFIRPIPSDIIFQLLYLSKEYEDNR